MAKRENIADSKLLSIGRITLDCERESLLLDNEVVSLRPQSFKVLRILAEHRDKLVARDRLLAEVWQDRVVTDDSLVQCLVDIRRALSGIDRNVVLTLPGRGYIFQSELVGVKRASLHSSALRSRYAATALAVMILAAIVFFYQNSGEELEPIGEAARISVAVLPFADMTENQDKRFLAEGLAEEVLNQLAQSENLRVISRTSSFSFSDDESDIATIAEKLAVTHVLEGSVRQGDDRLRISVQLVDAADNTQRWSRTYDRPLGDILQVQRDIAESVASSLDTTLRYTDRHGDTVNPYAHTLIIQARSELRLRDWGSAEHAKRLLRRALEIDPDNANALAVMALAERRAAYGKDAVSRKAAWENALIFTNQALAIDPNHPFALAQVGWAELYYFKDYAAAARVIERATEIDPTNPEVIRLVTNASVVFDRPEVAMRLGQHILERDPLCLPCQTFLVATASKSGNLELAELTARRLLDLNPAYLPAYEILGDVLLAKGEPQAALALYAERTDESAGILLSRARARYRLGHQSEFEKLRQRMTELYADSYPTYLAQLEAIGGNVDAAFEWLDRHLAEPTWAREVNYLSENYENLHGDPRWNDYLREFGLSPAQVARIDFQPTLPL